MKEVVSAKHFELVLNKYQPLFSMAGPGLGPRFLFPNSGSFSPHSRNPQRRSRAPYSLLAGVLVCCSEEKRLRQHPWNEDGLVRRALPSP